MIFNLFEAIYLTTRMDRITFLIIHRLSFLQYNVPSIPRALLDIYKVIPVDIIVKSF